MSRFARGAVKTLVVTDMTARGIDVPGCDAVFNLEMPRDSVGYLHRAGRTGRMGAPGVVVSIVAPHEVGQLQKMYNALGVTACEVHVSHGEVRPGAMPRVPPGRREAQKRRGRGREPIALPPSKRINLQAEDAAKVEGVLGARRPGGRKGSAKDRAHSASNSRSRDESGIFVHGNVVEI